MSFAPVARFPEIQPEHQPDVRPLPGHWWAPTYELQADWTVPPDLVKTADNHPVVVPAGFRTDISSEWIANLVLGFLPAALLWFFGVRADGPHRAAAVAHDYLARESIVDRETADWVFYQLMKRGGMDEWRAWPRWQIVRGYSWLVIRFR